MAFFGKSLRATYHLVSDDEMPLAEDTPGLRSFIEAVRNDTDWLLPARHLSSSFRRVLESDGPYSPSHLYTKEGFFSALVYRGITHHTEFLHEHPTFYPSLEAYQSEIQPFLDDDGGDTTYVCKKNAYGHAVTQRSTANATHYWAVANDAQFYDTLFRQPPANFLEVFNEWKGKIVAFGPLTLYQLLADYARAGLLCQPTLDELAEIVRIIHAGAFKALNLLGWSLASDVDSRPDIANALRVVHDRLESAIPLRVRKAVEFGPIFVEHALCKLVRYYRHFRDEIGGLR